MCFRISIVFFFLMVTQKAFAVSCENLILDDFNFSYEGNEIQVSLREESKQKWDVGFVKNKNSKNISGAIQVRNNEKSLCFEKKIDIDPIKLCREDGNNIAPWRFVTYGEIDILSVVALTARISENTVLFNSRICKTAKVLGRSYIHNSSIENGDIYGAEDNSVERGEPEDPRNTDGDPSIPRFPEVPKKLNFNYFTVKMSNVEIIGNPSINGVGKGIFIKNYKIVNSPTISGEISFNGKSKISRNTIVGNGSYSGVSFPRNPGDILAIKNYIPNILVPVITDDLSGDNNRIEGSYFIERKVNNSIIQGEVSRWPWPNGNVDVVTHISPHSTVFESSEFIGFGHVGGEVQAQSYIHGFYVAPVTHGVLFESGVIKNAGTLSGALYAKNVTIDDAEANGILIGPTIEDALQMNGLSINRSEIHGGGYFTSSSLYMSYVTGRPHLKNAHLSHSTISCNARVRGTYYGLTAGCDDVIPPDFKVKKNSRNAQDLTRKIRESLYATTEEIEKNISSHEIQGLSFLNKKLELRGRR